MLSTGDFVAIAVPFVLIGLLGLVSSAFFPTKLVMNIDQMAMAHKLAPGQNDQFRPTKIGAGCSIAFIPLALLVALSLVNDGLMLKSDTSLVPLGLENGEKKKRCGGIQVKSRTVAV